MKLKKLLILAAAALCCAACEKEETPVAPAEAVAGTYAGWTSAEFSYSPTPMVTDGEQLTLTATGDTTVAVAFTSSTWGTFACTATVTAVTGGYRLAGSGTTLMGMTAESQKEYAATFTGTVDAQGAGVFVFEVPAVMGGLTITFTEGDAPAE